MSEKENKTLSTLSVIILICFVFVFVFIIFTKKLVLTEYASISYQSGIILSISLLLIFLEIVRSAIFFLIKTINNNIKLVFSKIISKIVLILLHQSINLSNKFQNQVYKQYTNISIRNISIHKETISLIFQNQQIKKIIYLAFSIIMTLLLFVISGIFASATLSDKILIGFICFLPFCLLVIRYLIIDYRITKGYYGTNKYEAREILNFIQRQSKEWDPPDDGDQNRSAFPDVVSVEGESVDGLAGEGAV